MNILVTRDTTERPEAVDCGAAKLVGTDPDTIFKESSRLIESSEYYDSMTVDENPFGDGLTSRRIADILDQGLR